jgi:WD40 repeat protein
MLIQPQVSVFNHDESSIYPQAAIVIWDLEKMAPVQRFALHKGKVQALTFSLDEQYLASLGGPDDNKLVVWDLETGDPVCGALAANDVALTVKFFNNNSLKLVTGGNLNLRQWDVDLANRKVHSRFFTSLDPTCIMRFFFFFIFFFVFCHAHIFIASCPSCFA